VRQLTLVAVNEGRRTQMKNPAYTTINFVGPADLRRDLHDAAAAEDRSVSSILRAICRRYLDERRRTAKSEGKAA
jgi:hypothetical protein